MIGHIKDSQFMAKKEHNERPKWISVLPVGGPAAAFDTSEREFVGSRTAVLGSVKVATEALAEEAKALVNGVASAIRAAATEVSPTAMEIKLSLSFTADANVVLGKLGGTSSVEITLKW
jgi:hypothetical protein